jgi:cell shape-determining protein MreD
MTRGRVAVAAAGIVTALLLQAAVVGPVVSPYAVSLPLVLVAAVGLVDGPATGLGFGFAAGLVADLGSAHPAGVFALVWMGVGLLCGLVADRQSLRRDAVTAGILCGVGSSVATLVLALVSSRAGAWDAVHDLVPSALGDIVLAFGVLALVRRMLHTDALRKPAAVYTELTGVGRG